MGKTPWAAVPESKARPSSGQNAAGGQKNSDRGAVGLRMPKLKTLWNVFWTVGGKESINSSKSNTSNTMCNKIWEHN